jgi:hypothetical protein
LQATAGKLKSLRIQRAIKLCERIKIQRETTVHHLPANIYSFSGGKKNIKFFSPATTEQNIAHVNLFHKPSVSFYLMAIVAIAAIHQECIIPVALFNWSVVTY